MVIYKITNLKNNKIYIGQTRTSFKRRLSQHRKSDSLVGRALRKYEDSSFSFEIIDKASSIEELNNKEIMYIQQFNSLSPNGYNLDSGGKEKKPSGETIFKIRKSRKKVVDVDLNCQIVEKGGGDGFRLRVYMGQGRVELGTFTTRQKAINYYEYCKKIDKFKKIIYPRVSKYKERYRLRVSVDGKRNTLGAFNSKEEALEFYYKEYYNGNHF